MVAYSWGGNEETTLKPIRDVFINMQNGEISKPIETSNGYFIIKIENKKKEVQDLPKCVWLLLIVI